MVRERGARDSLGGSRLSCIKPLCSRSPGRVNHVGSAPGWSIRYRITLIWTLVHRDYSLNSRPPKLYIHLFNPNRCLCGLLRRHSYGCLGSCLSPRQSSSRQARDAWVRCFADGLHHQTMNRRNPHRRGPTLRGLNSKYRHSHRNPAAAPGGFWCARSTGGCTGDPVYLPKNKRHRMHGKIAGRPGTMFC